MKTRLILFVLALAVLLAPQAALADEDGEGFTQVPLPRAGITACIPADFLPVLPDTEALDPRLAEIGLSLDTTLLLFQLQPYLFLAFSPADLSTISAVIQEEPGLENLSDLNDAQVARIANQLSAAYQQQGLQLKNYNMLRTKDAAWLRLWVSNASGDTHTLLALTVRHFQKYSVELAAFGASVTTRQEAAFWEAIARTVWNEN